MGLALLALLTWPSPALAHHCGEFGDCGGIIAAIGAAVGIALIAIGVLLLLPALLGVIESTIIGARALKVVGGLMTGKGFLEAFTGREVFTGQKLTWLDRVVGIIPGGPGGGVADDVARAAQRAERGLVRNLRSISADTVNAPFVARGWNPPYSAGSRVRTFTTKTDLKFVRVTTDSPVGAFLVRPKDIAGMRPEQIRIHLALPKVPTHILDVNVPAGTKMQTGIVAAQPSFGVLTRGGIQYQILDQIPTTSFGPMRQIK